MSEFSKYPWLGLAWLVLVGIVLASLWLVDRTGDHAEHLAAKYGMTVPQAERQLGSDGGRLGWLVASTVVVAALQQAVDEQGEPLFLLKGGTLLQHRLPRLSRATTDLDGLVRGDLDRFVEVLLGPVNPVYQQSDRPAIAKLPSP